ncbi:MAG: LysR substrate-binding domain-containing protein [Pseudomonadota bacterium]
MQHDADALSNKLRIRQLRCFVTVARKKSFVAAAESLGLTQPAVSRSVRELELTLGHDLFDRSTRGAELTKRGQDFLDAAEAGLLQIWQGAKAVIGEVGSNEAVRIGALPNVCSQFLPKVIEAFKAEFPEVTVIVNPGTNAGLLSDLRLGATDLVIGRLSSSEDMRGLIFEALYDEPLVFVVRSEHPLSGGPALLQDALDYPMMLPPEGTIIRQEISRFLAGHGAAKLANIIETTSSDFQRAYLASTDCVAVIPKGVVQSDLDSGALRDLSIGHGELQGPVGLTTNPEINQVGAVSLFLQSIRDNIPETI